jgi:hypothetical protein
MEKNGIRIDFLNDNDSSFIEYDTIQGLNPSISIAVNFISTETGGIKVETGKEIVAYQLEKSYSAKFIQSESTIDNNGTSGGVRNLYYYYLDFSDILSNKDYISFIKKYIENANKSNYKLSFSITIKIPTTKRFTSLIETLSIYPFGIGSKFEDYFKFNYMEKSTIYLVPIENKTEISLDTLSSRLNTIKKEYDQVKSEYEWTIQNESVKDDLIDESSSDPSSLEMIITRLLELKEGTLNPSIELLKNSKLIVNMMELKRISSLIDQFTSKYPNTTLGDGEGIPYFKNWGVEFSTRVKYNNLGGDSQDDYIGGVILRMSNGVLYNSLLESSPGVPNEEASDYIANYGENFPLGLTWNSDGWTNLYNLGDRNFTGLNEALSEDIDSNILKMKLIARNPKDNKYWRIEFTEWDPSNDSFEYKRTDLKSI